MVDQTPEDEEDGVGRHAGDVAGARRSVLGEEQPPRLPETPPRGVQVAPHGAGDVAFVYVLPPFDLPPPPGVAADDYRIDVAAFDTFIGSDLPDTQASIAGLFAENQAAFEAIPRATIESPLLALAFQAGPRGKTWWKET